MNKLLEWIDYIEDNCQQSKVLHKPKEIIIIVLFATLATKQAPTSRHDF